MTEISQIPFMLGGGLSGSGLALTLDPSFVRSYLAGLQLSNDSTSPNTVLDISAGVCVDSTNAYLIKLDAFTKSTAGAWSAGSGHNGMGAGLTVTESWYHVFAILIQVSGVIITDIYFDTSPIAANAPLGTVAFRRIGSFATNPSSQIDPFIQIGDDFIWTTAFANSVSVGTTPTLVGLATPPGVVTKARVRCVGVASGGGVAGYLVTSPYEGSNQFDTPTANQTANGGYDATLDVLTNTSNQICAQFSAAGGIFYAITYGWIDRRGRDD